MNVWIVARSHHQGSAYVHALTEKNQNIRLLQPNGSFPSARTSTFAVGQMWDLAFTPAHRSFPNGEDVLISRWKQLDPEPHLQTCLSQRVIPWQGGPDQLFAGHVRSIMNKKKAFISDYKASVPDVPGCVEVGETREEAVQRVREALQTYLEMQDSDHASVPEPQTTAQYIRLSLALNQEQSSSHTLQDTLSTTLRASRCSFCQKQQGQNLHLTTGPGGVNMCNECVEYCWEMIEEGTADFQQMKQALCY